MRIDEEVYPYFVTREDIAVGIAAELDAKKRFHWFESDKRPYGLLGEFCTGKWMVLRGFDLTWGTDEKDQPDAIYRATGARVDIKTQVIQESPIDLESRVDRCDYTAPITVTVPASVAKAEYIDHFFFTFYNRDSRWLYLLGGISQKEFLRPDRARFHPAGSVVHRGYTLSYPGYVLDIMWLDGPEAWLKSLKRQTSPKGLK